MIEFQKSGRRSVMVRSMMFALALSAGSPALAQQAMSAAVAHAATADAARLAAARTVVEELFPSGTMNRMMAGTLDMVSNNIVQGMTQMPIQSIATMANKTPQEITKLGQAKLSDLLSITDPAFNERMSIVMKTTMFEVTRIMVDFEPTYRDGLSDAYANRYSLEQLTEINRFFATSTGKEYAAEAMLIAMRPEVMSKMQTFIPQMMQQMPAIMQKVQAATSSLPPPRTFAQLTAAEKAKFNALLGEPAPRKKR